MALSRLEVRQVRSTPILSVGEQNSLWREAICLKNKNKIIILFLFKKKKKKQF